MMESTIGQLQKILIGKRDDLEAIFAKHVLQNFRNGAFPSQDELSKSLFISSPTITKICKKLGYSGFRQFNEHLKMEYQRYVLDRKQNLADPSIISEMLKTSLSDVNQNNDFIKKLRQAVYEKQALTIFPSYQSESSGKFLRDYLNSKNIQAKVWNSARNFIVSIQDFIGNNEPILFIFTGPDNYLNYQNYDNLVKKGNHEIFVITTTGQMANFPPFQRYVLKSNLKYSNAFVRETLLQLLFLETFE